jgi:hypothetical protein
VVAVSSRAYADRFGRGTGDDSSFYESFGDDPTGNLSDPATVMLACVLEEAGDPEDWVLGELIEFRYPEEWLLSGIAPEGIPELIGSSETGYTTPDEINPHIDQPYFHDLGDSSPSDHDPEKWEISSDPSNDVCKEPEDPMFASTSDPNSSPLDDDGPSPPLEVEPIPPPIVADPYGSDDDDWGDWD